MTKVLGRGNLGDSYVLSIDVLSHHLQLLLGGQELAQHIKRILERGKESIEMPTNVRSKDVLECSVTLSSFPRKLVYSRIPQ